MHTLDCRTRRTYAARVSGPGNVSAKALAEQVPDGPLPAGIEVLLVVSSLTVLGTPVIDELLGPTLYRLFDLGHGNSSEMPGLHPDAIEAWPYDPNVFETLLKRLEPYQPRRAAVGRHSLRHQRRDELLEEGRHRCRRASPSSSPAGCRTCFAKKSCMAGQYMKFMQTVIEGKIGIERLGWNTNGSDLVQIPPGALPRPALRDRLRNKPLLLPTEGWPEGTNENPQKPPDWTWRMDIVRDERTESQRCPVRAASRPGAGQSQRRRRDQHGRLPQGARAARQAHGQASRQPGARASDPVRQQSGRGALRASARTGSCAGSTSCTPSPRATRQPHGRAS